MRLPHASLDQLGPLGIVIADGGHQDRPTRFSAFVWGPVPDEELVMELAPRRVASVRPELVAVPA